MSIIGLTHDNDGRVIQRLSVRTKVAIGLPADEKAGRKYPMKLDHFIFLCKPDEAKKGTDWQIDPELTKHYGASPRELEIILLDDDLENVFPTQLAWWTQSQCRCWGNGQSATRRTKEHPEGQAWAPCGQTCPDLQEDRCKPSGDLRFMLADFPQLGAVARIHTTSYRSIQQIHSSIQQIQIITGGRLAGIRAKVVVRPEKTSYEDKTGRHSTTIYALSLEIKADGIKKLVGQMTETARLFEQTKRSLGVGHIQVLEDDEDKAPELEKEFYRDRPEAEPIERPTRASAAPVVQEILPASTPVPEPQPQQSDKKCICSCCKSGKCDCSSKSESSRCGCPQCKFNSAAPEVRQESPRPTSAAVEQPTPQATSVASNQPSGDELFGPQPGQSKPAGPYATTKQITKLIIAAKASGVDIKKDSHDDIIHKMLKANYGIESLTEIPVAQFDEILKLASNAGPVKVNAK